MRDKIHYSVKSALENDGWEIKKDPFLIKLKDVTVQVDLEAEKFFEVEKAGKRILVEIKSLEKTSILYEFYGAYGQYDFYRKWVNDHQSGHVLFMAISSIVYERIRRINDLMDWIVENKVNLIIVNLEHEIIEQWIQY
ncbi:MAG: hypothetical protein HC912_03355 [Saprospiraceae bacterium]|nr:hypothetical protein [Saprospiraceae bacterium]